MGKAFDNIGFQFRKDPDQLEKTVKDPAEIFPEPGAAPVNCGHYLMHNLAMAKWYAAEFAAYLEANADNRAIFEYPQTERLVTDDGQRFFDS